MSQQTADSLIEYLNAAEEAAQQAAKVLQDWRQRFRVHEKGRFDLVTDADLASQHVIHDFLSRKFPGHGFLEEENRAGHGRPPADAPPTWIVDPIDGTTNYVHDYPFYCISIGLEIAGELVVGVVLDPRHGELFKAAKGLGAWLGQERLAVSKTNRLENALLATGFPADMRGREVLLDWWRFFSERAHGLRRTGSTALNLAYIAAGRFDGFWAFDNNAWDVAAGVILIREAGGSVTNVDGSPFDPHTPDALASNGVLQPTLLDCFRTGP